jgi:hypothetical protein
MKDSVLNLGEKIALAARLAAIEHVRQMLEEAQGERREDQGGAPIEGFKDEPTPQTLPLLARTKLPGLVMPIPAQRVRGAA